MTPLQAIKQKCLDCMSGQKSEVRLCPCDNCPLWPFRSGRNPNRAGVGGRGHTPKNANSRPDFEAQNENSKGAGS